MAAAWVGLMLLAGAGLSGFGQAGPPLPEAPSRAPVSEGGRGALVPDPGGPGVECAPTGGNLETPAASGNSAGSTLVDINQADPAGLQTLPGVGPTLARRIAAHRALHGRFRTPTDLLRVSGIGAKRYARLQGRIRTAEAP
jgi:competence ComEA-like helix-hairpin-helix protein